MLSRLAAMVKNVGVRAPGLRQCGGQFGHPREIAVVVDGLGQAYDVGSEPGGVKGDGAERVAEDVANQVGLSEQFLGFDRPRTLSHPASTLRAAFRAAIPELLRAAYHEAFSPAPRQARRAARISSGPAKPSANLSPTLTAFRPRASIQDHMRREQATANSRSFRSLALSRRNSSIFCGSVQASQSVSLMVVPQLCS